MRDAAMAAESGARGGAGSTTLGRVVAVAGLTFREAWRRKVVVAALVMTGAFLGLYGFAIHLASRDFAQSAGTQFGPAMYRSIIGVQLLFIGLYPASLIVGLLAVLASAGSIAAELDTGVLCGVLARPIRRWELLLGKFIGTGLMVGTYAAVLFSAVIGLAWWLFKAPVTNVPLVLALLVLEPLILLAVTLLGSSRLSTMAAGVTCVAAYGIATVGGLIEQIGAFTKNATMMNIGVITSLLMPIDAVQRKAMAILQPASALVSGQTGPFGSAGRATPSNAMLVYTGVYVVVVLWLAMRAFAQRDL